MEPTQRRELGPPPRPLMDSPGARPSRRLPSARFEVRRLVLLPRGLP